MASLSSSASSSLGPVGFVGVGIMGEGMAMNLLKGGKTLILWNRSKAKCDPLTSAYPDTCVVVDTPQEVVAKCATTFCMLSTLEASQAVFPQVLEAVTPGKSIVDCATLTPEYMQEMEAKVVAKGGKFLEAPVSGSKGPAAMGALIFLAGGDQGLYESVVGDELDLMGKASFHFGPVGSGTKMKLVVNMTMGSMLTCLAEGAALAEASSLSTGQLLEVLDLGVMSNLMFRLKGPNMLKRKHTTHFPLKHAQKDMRFALALGDDLGQALPLAAAANEAMKRARSLGHGDDDFSSVYEASRLAPAEQPVAVLFDFDGTLGDTETPAMEIAFWELAPYIPGATAANVEAQCKPFMIENAGKAFEFMTDSCNEERKAAGLPPIAEARGNATGGAIDAALAAVVDGHRAKFGLPPLAEANAGATSGEGSEEAFLQLQKDETVAALGKCARANAGVVPTLVDLQAGGVKYSIATTSGKPRVPVCVDAASLRPFFPPDKIHSGESDFDPPKFKPAPDVYLRAAAGEGKNPAACVAVEDSASGVGSAANAGCGLIVGYVGATHIPAERKDSHAKMLMEGKRADDGRGAEVVISEFQDLLPIVAHFNACYQASEAAAGFLPLPESLTQSFKGPFWVRS